MALWKNTSEVQSMSGSNLLFVEAGGCRRADVEMRPKFFATRGNLGGPFGGAPVKFQRADNF